MAVYNKTLNEIAYDFLELYRANHKDTDSVDIRQVKHWIDATRNTLLKQRLDRNPFAVDYSWIQTFDVVGASSTYFESTNPIPVPINRRGGEGCIVLVDSGVLFAEPIEFVTYDEARSYNNGKFNSSTKYAFIKAGKFFVKNETTLTSFKVSGVFQSPSIAAVYDQSITKEEFESNYDYPVDQSILDQMKEIITKANFTFVVQQIEDKVADGTDSTTKQG